jgi:hypothetical protein
MSVLVYTLRMHPIMSGMLAHILLSESETGFALFMTGLPKLQSLALC